MAVPAKSRASYEDLLAVPSHQVAEIIDGELRVTPRPAPRHARAASRLVMRLGRLFDEGDGGPGGWWILAEPELHLLEGEVVVPDLAGWRVERMQQLPDTAFFTLVPDWIAEVLSHSTAATDRADKMPIYARAGVGHAWLVDPELRTIEIYRRQEARWPLLDTLKGEGQVRAEPFEAVAFDTASLWQRPASPR